MHVNNFCNAAKTVIANSRLHFNQRQSHKHLYIYICSYIFDAWMSEKQLSAINHCDVYIYCGVSCA